MSQLGYIHDYLDDYDYRRSHHTIHEYKDGQVMKSTFTFESVAKGNLFVAEKKCLTDAIATLCPEYASQKINHLLYKSDVCTNWLPQAFLCCITWGNIMVPVEIQKAMTEMLELLSVESITWSALLVVNKDEEIVNSVETDRFECLM